MPETEQQTDSAQRLSRWPLSVGKKTKKRVRNFTPADRAAHRVFEKSRREAFNGQLLVCLDLKLLVEYDWQLVTTEFRNWPEAFRPSRRLDVCPSIR